MDRAASPSPAMTNRSQWPPAACHDKMKIAFILDDRHEAIIVIRVHIYFQGTFPAPVAAPLEITNTASGHFAKLLVNVCVAHAGLGTYRCLFRTHGHHHV